MISILSFKQIFMMIVDCKWKEWGEWQACNPSCGDGNQNRTRAKAIDAQNGGAKCNGSDTDSKACSEEPCPGE